VLGWFLLLALVLGLLGALLLVIPTPVPGLRARIETELSEALGLQVQIDSAQLWVFERRLVLRGVRAGAVNPLSIEQAEATLRWEDWRMWRSPVAVEGSEVEGVRGGEIHLDAEGIRLQSGGKLLTTWPASGEEHPPFDLVTFSLPSMVIHDAEIAVVEDRPGGEVSLFACGDLSCEVASDADGALALVRGEGMWRPERGDERPFRIMIERTGEYDLSVVGALDGFDTEEFLPLPGEVQLVGQSLWVHAMLDLTPGEPVIDVAISGDDVQWDFTGVVVGGPLGGPELEAVRRRGEPQPHAELHLRLDEGGNRWVLEESSVTITEAELTAQGSVRREPGWPMEVRLGAENAPLSRELINIFLGRFGIDVVEGDVGVEITLEGLATEPENFVITGQLNFGGGEIRILEGPLEGEGSGFATAIHFLREGGEQVFWTEGVHGRLGDAEVAIRQASVRTSLTGDGEHRRDMEVAVIASGELTDLVGPLPPGMEAMIAETPRGRLRLEGEITHTIWPDRPPGETGLESLPAFAGRLRLSGGELVLAAGDERVQVPHLLAEFDNASVRWSEAEAHWGGSNIAVSGHIGGDTVFWHDPRLEVHGDAEVDVAEAYQALGEAVATVPLSELPHGTLLVCMGAEGPLFDVSSWQTSTSLIPRSVGATISSGEHRYRVRLVGGEVEVDPAAIELRGLVAKVNGLPLEINGLLTPDQGHAVVSARCDGAQAAESFHRFLSQAILGGPISAEIALGMRWAPDRELEAAQRGGWDMTRGATLARISRALQGQFGAHMRGESPPGFDLGGRFQFMDCKVTPLVLPEDLTHVRGLMTWDGREFQADWLDMQAGVNRDVTLASARYCPTNPVHIQLDLIAPELDLTPWVRAWRRRDWISLTTAQARALSLSRGRPDRIVTVEGSIDANRILWRALEGAASRAIFRNQFDRAAHVTDLRIDAAPLNGYGGRISGHFRNTRTDLGLAQEVQARVEDVDAETFLADLTQSETTLAEGTLDGEITLRVAPDAGWDEVTGEGWVEVQESTVLQPTLFRQLSDLTHIPAFANITFATVSAGLTLGENRIDVTDLLMSTVWVSISGDGVIGFDRSLDFDADIQMVRRFVQDIPVIRTLVRWGGDILNDILLTVRIEGTIDEPAVRLSQPLVDVILPH
jgi:AsmA-like protein